VKNPSRRSTKTMIRMIQRIDTEEPLSSVCRPSRNADRPLRVTARRNEDDPTQGAASRQDAV
jgi:hypothetical protein